MIAVPGFAADDDLAAKFRKPMPEYSPVPIWWWSGDRIEQDRVREQLEKIAAGGIHHAIILNLAPSGPLYGSAADDPPFLTPQWWDLFAYALREAKRVGVRLWFYDQLGFSGSGLQARVVRDHSEFRGISLAREIRDVDGPGNIEIRVPTGGTALAAFVAQAVRDSGAGPQVARWIWDGAALAAVGKRNFRRVFDLVEVPASAHINVTCDNGYVLYVNGRKVGEETASFGMQWQQAERFEVAGLLHKGRNCVAVVGDNVGGPAGLLLEMVSTGPAGKATVLVSDSAFKVNERDPEGWPAPDFDDRGWAAAHAIGTPPMPPWGAIHGIEASKDTSFGERFEQVRDVGERIAEGVLHVQVPQGRYRVQLYYSMPGGFDYHNAKAGRALLDVVHGEMERRFRDELGKGIAGSFQDEFPPMPRFSRSLIEEFHKRAGYDLLTKLPALFDDIVDRFGDSEGPTTAQIRCDANRVAAELCEEGFFRPLFDWHEKYGMWCGYDQTVRNADPIGGEGYYVDYFKTMRHFAIPGNDHGGDAKPHQSIAELYGRPRVWLEGFHSSGWGQTLEEIGTLLHPWLVNGSTLYNPHAIYYSTHGSFWEWAPPDTGWRQPYFKHYPVLADYVSRLCFMLTQGHHINNVAVLHPAGTVHAFSGFGPPLPTARRASELYWAAQNSLRARKIDYLILDEDSVRRARVEDGLLKVRDSAFRIVVLPGTVVIDGAMLKRLSELAEAGGMVVVLGDPPTQAADRGLSKADFDKLVQTLRSKMLSFDDPAEVARIVTEKNGRDMAEELPMLHRRVGDRDFYFILSDDGTPAAFVAEYDINKRELWKNPAGQGGRLSIDLGVKGVPEHWDALTGEVVPILNYRQANGRTRIEVELASSPAPLVAIRPAKSDEPTAIESDLEIQSCQPIGDGAKVKVRGWPRWDHSKPLPAEHHVRVEYAGKIYQGSRVASKVEEIGIEGPLACRLEPTADNRDGSFSWPPTQYPLPVEVRGFRYRAESAGEDASRWNMPDFDDRLWDVVCASYGPRAEWAGPLKLGETEKFETISADRRIAEPFSTAEYSLRLGINEDPIYATALGGKGMIPEEFIDLGGAKPGDVYAVRTAVILMPNMVESDGTLPATLRIGGQARKRAFLNGQEVRFESDPAARILQATVILRAGQNVLTMYVSRATEGRLRLFYQFLPAEGIMPDPQWIWNGGPNPTGRFRFVKTIQVPDGPIRSAAMVAALGEMHQIRLNGRLVADQGNFDPYFTSRSERYDLTAFVKSGDNYLEIEARDPGIPIGLLLDGLIEMQDGKTVPFVSDASFNTVPAAENNAATLPARILAAPAQGYMGETAALLLRPRLHPLPQAGWLVNQPFPTAPFDRLIYSPLAKQALTGWYRFIIPPGAAKMFLQAVGEVVLYVDGRPMQIEDGGLVKTIQLPDPQSVRRVATLRIISMQGFTRGAAILAPITFKTEPGRIPLGSWDELGLPNYSGGLVYSTEVDLPDAPSARVVMDLGRVRGSVDVSVNGKLAGTRIWHPYRFDLTASVKPGKNQLEIRVLNTLGPFMGVGHPSNHVFENQTHSGIYGPVQVRVIQPVDMELNSAS